MGTPPRPAFQGGRLLTTRSCWAMPHSAASYLLDGTHVVVYASDGRYEQSL